MTRCQTTALAAIAACSLTTIYSISAAARPQPPPTPDMIQTGTDIPKDWKQPQDNFDYTRTEVMIPMRDGIKLHTVIMAPKGAKSLPMLLERTPYDANFFSDTDSPHMHDAVWSGDRDWANGHYILVWQDIRGKYGSKGDYVMTRPPRGPLNPTKTDDTTDAWDTVDWLVKHVQGTNGKVGLIGSSYDGWTVVMALLDPHPAVKVAAPESPMIDGWMGDDWYHYGAFREINLDYFIGQTSKTGKGQEIPRWAYDDYENYLMAGSAGALAESAGFDQLPFWKRFAAHPAYDAFWQEQALDKLVASHPSRVPTVWLQGFWDQEDIYGAVHTWEALKAAGHEANNHLVIGPWRHSQINGDGWNLGPLKWNGDTTADFRQHVLIPFFDMYLQDNHPATAMPQVMVFDPAEKKWGKFADWPGASQLTPIYLQSDFALAFHQAAPGGESYVSDPSKPVSYLQRPIPQQNEDAWRTWLVQDQRFVSNRTDVLSYETPVLDHEVRLEGAPVADIFAKTTGTDGDFVVKVIDVYPPTYAAQPEMGGYELPIALDIFRGRYRRSFSNPSPIPAGRVQEYKFRLPTVNYTFRPGHRIMVQIQSSLFPVYDRNPQTYVPNILFAKPSDFHKATVTIMHGPDAPSAVLLPVVGSGAAKN
jgi:putative CocE/NonD family hydrolase